MNDMDIKARVLSREVVERTAYILGEGSACARALEDAKRFTNPVFVNVGHGIVVAERGEPR